VLKCVRLLERTMRSRPSVSAAAIVVIGTWIACSSPDQPTQPSSDEGSNTLTSAERAAGWRLLFDGRKTSGWRGFRQQNAPAGWQVVDGALTRVGSAGDLITIDQFTSFELMLEWQIAEGGNSGIMFRVSEAADATYLTGPEMQVLDNARHPDGMNPLSSAGACYGLYPPREDVTRPVGSWNQVRLVANGSRIEHWLNGVRIVEYELGSADWLARLQASPFRDVPSYGREARGHIAVQDHGDRVAYRSIKIRVLGG
jgi:3-keto-disaccharide hydrolase